MGDVMVSKGVTRGMVMVLSGLWILCLRNVRVTKVQVGGIEGVAAPTPTGWSSICSRMSPCVRVGGYVLRDLFVCLCV